MSDATLEYATLLQEKEDLIDALTERLEMTAEQLDRMQRTTGDRGHWLAGGVPAELVEQQQALCEDLGRVVQQWEDAQPGVSLSRIEMQLQELRDLIVQLPSGGGFGAESRETPSHRIAVAGDDGGDEAAEASGWETLKAGLLAQSHDDGASQSGHHVASEQSVSDGPDPFDGKPLEAPAAIDLDDATRDELQYAVLARDEFIVELLRRLRSVEGRTRPSDSWKSLENVPDDLRVRLESLERRLEQASRMSEVELSIERAKLGREAARLKQLEESTQKAANRVGLAMADVERAEADEDQPESQADGRWLRMLGRNKRDK